jgi:5-methylthioadenosine/S-adenosylhomocysteine deaminase
MSEERRQGAASAPVPADLLVLGGIVVTMDERRTVLPRGGLAIRDGRIVAVGPRDDIARAHAALEVIDANDDLVIPGLVDGHTHIAMTLFRGLADDLPLHVWLDEDNLVPLYDVVSHLAYAVEAADVRTVLVDGRLVVRDGRLVTADEAEIRRQVRAVAREIGSLRGVSGADGA